MVVFCETIGLSAISIGGSCLLLVVALTLHLAASLILGLMEEP